MRALKVALPIAAIGFVSAVTTAAHAQGRHGHGGGGSAAAAPAAPAPSPPPAAPTDSSGGANAAAGGDTSAAGGDAQATLHTEGGRRIYVASATLEVRGEIQRPYAFSLSGRSSLGYTYLDVPVHFVEEILSAVRHAPF
jgi:hypothetical protein